MIDVKNYGKIKNEKVHTDEFSTSFLFDSEYYAGKENVAVDAITQTRCTTFSEFTLHKSLYHPGVTRMVLFIQSRNLPHSVEKICKMTANKHAIQLNLIFTKHPTFI